ncbi:MAG TPA: peroxiredoxin-like family protein [Chitinophaga sp.]|uniref:peroxiredoxin-like family protein n=1 Tax=Chitinophaga sp. TaxID=1869181 RepID=UPI002CA9513A|nr:peroxiredoxin-like family protein [Chitinophaga sp.]HVI45165.1 peroxiredoxin-like family protein [Chitinophaga sp.]
MKAIAWMIIFIAGTLGLNAQQMPSGIIKGAMAPDFMAKDQHGKTISLKDQLMKGPVVLVFYRGQWCPYCNKALKQLEDSLPMIKAKGAGVIAVSPEVPENVNKTVKKTGATYPVLFDDGMKIMKQYDVAYDVDPKTIEKYKGYGIDFNTANGSNGAHLPVPAVFVINKKGVVTYRHFDPDYKNRAAVSTILAQL